MLFLLLVACISEHTVSDMCEADGKYTICMRKVPHSDAVNGCEDFGGLVFVDTYDEGVLVADIGSNAFEGGWWVGWGEFDCPVMSQGIGSFPVPCDRLYPYICEMDDE